MLNCMIQFVSTIQGIPDRVINALIFSFNAESFATAAAADYDHTRTTFGKIEEGLVAVGGRNGGRDSREVELFSNGRWRRMKSDFERWMYLYSTATIKNKLYLFGTFITI